MPCKLLGTQKWNGAIPNFVVRAIVISIEAVGLNNLLQFIGLENIRLIMTAIINSTEAVD